MNMVFSTPDEICLPQSSPRQAVDLVKDLMGLSRKQIHLTADEKYEHEPMFWHSICTEHDSQNLYQNILATGMETSPEFDAFLGDWLRDEMIHAAGFKAIYHKLYGKDLQTIENELAARVIRFEDINTYFQDEFKLCLLLAYDEIVTTHVYYRSESFYEKIGSQPFKDWIHCLMRDETKHYIGLIRLLRNNHRHRLPEARQILQDIVAADDQITTYNGTFVLDHSCPEFPLTSEEIERLCIAPTLKKLFR